MRSCTLQGAVWHSLKNQSICPSVVFYFFESARTHDRERERESERERKHTSTSLLSSFFFALPPPPPQVCKVNGSICFISSSKKNNNKCTTTTTSTAAGRHFPLRCSSKTWNEHIWQERERSTNLGMSFSKRSENSFFVLLEQRRHAGLSSLLCSYKSDKTNAEERLTCVRTRITTSDARTCKLAWRTDFDASSSCRPLFVAAVRQRPCRENVPKYNVKSEQFSSEARFIPLHR